LAAALSITGTVVDFPDKPSLARVLPRLASARDAIRVEMGYLPASQQREVAVSK
jgi:hypothetical protein